MLVIKEANYGLGANTKNVTKHLQSKVKDGSIDILVGPKSMGTDPSVGSAKKLSVTYIADGVEEQKTIADGSQFAVYSIKQKEADDPRTQAGEATTSLFKTALSGMSTFLHLLGVGIAYKVGSTVFDPIVGYVLTAISLVVPYFGLWGIPMIIFWYRIFASQDVAALGAAPAQAIRDMTTVAK